MLFFRRVGRVDIGFLRANHPSIQTEKPGPMKTILRGAAFALLATTSLASAADLGAPAPAPYAPAAPIQSRADFGGLYFGFGPSLNWTATNQNVSPFGQLASFSYSVSRVRIGGSANFGYGVQTGDFYTGGEVSGGFDGAQGHIDNNPLAFGNQRIGLQGDARLRLGYALGFGPNFNAFGGFPTMVYATGGMAVADIHRGAWAILPGFIPAHITSQRTALGMTVGGGVETVVAPNVSVRAEYKFADYFAQRTLTHKVQTGVQVHF